MIRQLKIKWKFMLVVFITTMVPIVLVGYFSYWEISNNILDLHNKAVTEINKTWHQTAKQYNEQVQLFWNRELTLGSRRLESLSVNIARSMHSIEQNNSQLSLDEQLYKWMANTRDIRPGKAGNIILLNAEKQIFYSKGIILSSPQPLEQIVTDPDQLKTILGYLDQAQQKTVSVTSPWPDTTGQVQNHLMSFGYFENQKTYTICAQPVSAYKSVQLLDEIKQQYIKQSLHADSHDKSRIWIIDTNNNIIVPDGAKKSDLVGIEHFHPTKQLDTLFNQVRQQQPQVPIQSILTLTDPQNSRPIKHQLSLTYFREWNWIICVASHMDCVQNAHAQLLWGVLAIGCFALIIGTAIAYAVAIRMAKPIEELNEAATQVAWGSLSVDLSDLASRRDEYGELANAFHEMALGLKSKVMLLEMSQAQMKVQNQELTEEINQRKETEKQKDLLHEQLIETSREAGMAEIASTVLHNVGNELNSLNVTSTLVRETGQQTSLHHLFVITEMIRPHLDNFADFIENHPQGKLLPRALVELSDKVEPEYNYVMKGINELASGVDRIKHIIHAQQSYVTAADVNQYTDPAQIMEDALAINQAGIEHREIVIQKHLPKTPRVSLCKHKVLQILVNLISNAKHAMDAADDNRQIILQMVIHQHEGEHQLIYRVVDTGCGISPEHINQIFNHGFSTHTDGRGYGLHYSSITATELGGSLTIKSDGPGKGTTATLILPVTLEDKTTANPHLGLHI